MKDILFFIGLLVISPFVSLVTEANFLVMLCLFFVMPSLYLVWRVPGAAKKAALIALPAVPISIVIDCLAVSNGTWWVQTVFPFRIMDIVPVEDILYLFFVVFGITMAREYFFKEHHGVNFERWRLFNCLVFVLFAAFVPMYAYAHSLFIIRFLYAWLVLLTMILPVLAGFLFVPAMRISMVLGIGAYFFALKFLFEIVALYNGLWQFPSPNEYVGLLSFFHVQFPFEELLWMVLGAPAVLYLAEFGIGDLPIRYRKDL